MPKPPELPVIDWRRRLSEGMTWKQWLVHSEKPEHQQQILDRVADPPLTTEDRQRLAAIAQTVHVFAIAEDWCPDVVRHLPLIEAMARIQDRIRVRYFLRTQAPRELERHLTNGSESIPLLIFVSHGYSECGQWGPMGRRCREYLSRGRACGDMQTARELVFAHYAADPECHEEIGELLHCLAIASTTQLEAPD